MKILHLIQRPQNRGAEIFTCQLSNHLINLGHQVMIVALFDGENSLAFNGEIISLNASSKNRFFNISVWKKIARIVKKFKPDIIQANAGDTLKYAVFSKVLFRLKAPIVFRNASEVGRYLKSPIQRSLNAFLYKNVKFIISVSRASEKDIITNFPFLSGKTAVVPVGLEMISVIQEIKLQPENSKHVIHVGGFSFEKNHSGLLRIFQDVIKSNQNVHLHLVGDGPLRPNIESEAERMGLRSRISFYGFVNNPLSYIKQGDVLILPSIIEGLPGVLLEAMYCLTPVVAYDVGGISEIINDETGILIGKGKESEFANAVLETLMQPDENKILTARNMVLKKFMNQDIALKFIRVYNQVISSKRDSIEN